MSASSEGILPFPGRRRKRKPLIVDEPPAGAWYLAGFGGVNWLDDFNINYPILADQTPPEWGLGKEELDMETGWIAGIAMGYIFPEETNGRWRLELEGSYRTNDFEGPFQRRVSPDPHSGRS